eukprot:gb/GEZJ01001428.1/.p2 GENE.gb/GEZJ01001428.1/~~gb/GEZJ01001428.1/.p2  ORF type:complete len:119 (+),score=9.65 gb/GEZJ01001428.1/:457-813(+)
MKHKQLGSIMSRQSISNDFGVQNCVQCLRCRCLDFSFFGIFVGLALELPLELLKLILGYSFFTFSLSLLCLDVPLFNSKRICSISASFEASAASFEQKDDARSSGALDGFGFNRSLGL